MHRDPVVMAALGGVRDDAQTAAYLDRNLAHWATHGFGLWIVRPVDGAEAIGRAVLRHVEIEGSDEVEVGYAFYQEYWGRGLATEIATACLAHGRERLGLETIVALTSPANLASQHVLLKVGLARERDVIHEGRTSALFRVRFTDRM